MKKSKHEIYENIFKDCKDVLIEAGSDYCFEVAQCLTLNQLVKVTGRYKDVMYVDLKDMLVNVSNFKDMERMIAVMNVLFDNEDYRMLKDDLRTRLVKNMSDERYMVLRHLDTFASDVIYELYKNGLCDAKTCAKYSLIEDDYMSACEYLRTLDYCDDDAILDVLASYSFVEYMRLEMYYRSKQGQLELVF